MTMHSALSRRLAARAGLPLVSLVVAVALTSACSTSPGAAAPGTVSVAAAFYPLQFVVEQVGGSHVSVTPVTKPGGEPHDLELTPRDVVAVRQADLVVYERGFQPAMDAAVSQASSHAFDISNAAHLDLAAPAEGLATQGAAPPGGAAGARDPHFWLDPTRYASVAQAIGQRLAAVDPAHAADYRAGAARFVARLTQLDHAYRAGLASCAHKEIVTGHSAFGYLARRYGLIQEGIAGVTPDAEPDASTMESIVQRIRADHITTVYAETLVSPALSETIARETSAKVAVLDPIEGITSASRGKDYFDVMRSNLATLRAGQECA
ncbi:metal ABC transporter substrate-binding protein [Pedococcus sp.]|uniref:metal ABC transporter substrate-binding protein n=1 Tax=Pedococcus sp. TaxID=2860345 RepID=UPI002E14CB2A|nr:metal ABC transporter substrate-binding protein [Pedococcus sp.]